MSLLQSIDKIWNSFTLLDLYCHTLICIFHSFAVENLGPAKSDQHSFVCSKRNQGHFWLFWGIFQYDILHLKIRYVNGTLTNFCDMKQKTTTKKSPSDPKCGWYVCGPQAWDLWQICISLSYFLDCTLLGRDLWYVLEICCNHSSSAGVTAPNDPGTTLEITFHMDLVLRACSYAAITRGCVLSLWCHPLPLSLDSVNPWCLDMSGIYLLRWCAHYPIWVCNDW